MQCLLLILSLPSENATTRMRAWRALKSCGAGVLRDGVYVLPERQDCRATLAEIGEDVRRNGGIAHLLAADGTELDFGALFDRHAEFSALHADVAKLRATLAGDNASEALKQASKLRKTFAQIVAIDFFPGEAQRQTEAALQDLESAIAGQLSPDEPRAQSGDIPILRIDDYRGRVWATRRRPWVDRLACAWLIRRFIDPDARFVWIASPEKCPRKALGFDFDGARFSHVGNKVSFENLLASFSLDSAALRQLASLVHFLDVGGIETSDAAGIERVLRGLSDITPDDDQLLDLACSVFDGLHAAFQTQQSGETS